MGRVLWWSLSGLKHQQCADLVHHPRQESTSIRRRLQRLVVQGLSPTCQVFQWRSSTVERGVGNRIAPALIDKPTLLQGPTVQEDVPRNVRSDVGPTRPSEPETSKTQRQSRTLDPLLKSQTRVSTDSVQDGSDSIRSQNRVPVQPTAEVSKTLLRRDVSAAPTPLLDSRKIEDFQGRSSTVNVRASSVLPHQKAEAQFLDSAQSSEETSQATSLVRRIPASRLPPKVTWKPTHRQSPWRLHPTNQTDRVQHCHRPMWYTTMMLESNAETGRLVKVSVL